MVEVAVYWTLAGVGCLSLVQWRWYECRRWHPVVELWAMLLWPVLVGLVVFGWMFRRLK